MAGQGNSLKTISQNKKAFHDYFVVESMEAGIELCGTEVKAMRRGQCNLKGRLVFHRQGRAVCERHAHQPV